MMMCTDVNNDGKVDYMEFTERFHNPARDIGFNLAVLLINLKEHITNDPRLEKIIEKASTLLDYFDPYLGRIEIMGSINVLNFEIIPSEQFRDSKNSFLFNVLQDDGGDQGKLEAFINFCEDTIFEMQHAAEISSGDAADSKVERAMKQRDYFLQQTSPSEQLSRTIKTGYNYGVSAASALKPSNVSKSLQSAAAKIRAMTWAQLMFEAAKLIIRGGHKLGIALYLIACTIYSFGYFLMISGRDEEESEQAALPMPESATSRFQAQHSTEIPSYRNRSREYDIFGVHVHHDVDQQPPSPMSQTHTSENELAPPSPTPPPEGGLQTATPVPQQQASDIQSVGSAAFANVAMSQAGSDFDSSADFYEPKIAEQEHVSTQFQNHRKANTLSGILHQRYSALPSSRHLSAN
ncbi:unnamed protein product [Anisakis simplex]|uniref:Uncharacterized protein n=1 Tax=Anisakis simplex TaxID=6269 RepID=A0A3P6T9Y3_ANISI|nr:unnamed protein product [Anisakis simplex]